MARSVLAAIVTLGLLASGDVCSWLCQVASATAAVHAGAGSHCGGGSEPETPGPAAPSHDDCAGCSLDVAATSCSLEGPAGDFALAFATSLAFHELQAPRLRDGPARAERSPPRDVLSLTSSLRL